MLEQSNDNGDPSFYAFLYQWSARTSAIALGMVIPAVIGVGLDRLCGTVALFAILGMFLGMALGFWQLVKIAATHEQGAYVPRSDSGVDKSPDTRDNGTV
jgi:F0F1-type ATP synthase assembly protein I